MADFDIAFQWTMRFEDPKMACARVPDAVPDGCAGPCHAISGINSCLWPEDFSVISALPRDQRPQAVSRFYRTHYWNPWLEQIASDGLAKRVFDFGVNGGSATAARTLQKAVNSLDGSLAVDGEWGPRTMAAVNAADPNALVRAFISARVAYYRGIVAANPADAQYLDVWLSRAQA